MTFGQSNDNGKCMGVSANPDNGSVGVLIQGKIDKLQSGKGTKSFDSVLVLFDTYGRFDKVAAIYQKSNSIDMYSATNGLMNIPQGTDYERYLFAGYSGAFKTRY